MAIETILWTIYLSGVAGSLCRGWYLIAKAYAGGGKCKPEGIEFLVAFLPFIWPVIAGVFALWAFCVGVPFLLVKSGIVKAEKNGGVK